MHLNLRQKILFESVTVCRPLPPAGEAAAVASRAWVAAEAAAMGSPDNLLRVTKRLNLEATWALSADECIQKLKNMLTIETTSDSTRIRVIARSTKSLESAVIANAVIAAREEVHQENFLRRQPDQKAPHTARVEALDLSCAKKRWALREALSAASLLPEFNNDAAFKGLTLSGELAKLRDEWVAETVQLAEARAALDSLPPVPRYAEILEEATPSMHPVTTGFRARQELGTVGGAAAGLLLSFILGRFVRLPPDGPAAKASPPPSAVDY
jgi:hypothetical protein